MPQQLPVYLEEVARCHIKNGTVHFCWDGYEIALPVSTCLANMAACNRAIAEWEGSRANVVKFPDHAASS